MMTSAPASAARSAWASVCTWLKSKAPAVLVADANGLGSANEWLTAATPSSSAAAASSAVSGNEEMNPTPNGRSVRERAMWICSRTQLAPFGLVPPIIPKPPALETAAASWPVAVPAMEAFRIGCWIPSRLQSEVVIIGCLRDYAKHELCGQHTPLPNQAFPR